MSKPAFTARLRHAFESRVLEPIRYEVRRRSNSSREYLPVFIVGAMGSGTTLLAYELGSRLDFAGVVNESALEISRRASMWSPAIARFASVANYLDSLWPKPEWSIDQEREFLQALYRSRATHDRTHMIDKAPNASLARSAFLAQCFPEGRFVFTFRDPVVNIEGFRRKWPLFGREPISSSIRFYRELHEAFLLDSLEFGSRAITVRYEELVRSRENTIASLRDRLEIPWADGKRDIPTRSNEPGQGIRNVSGNEIKLVKDANESSYARLTTDEVRQIREELGDLHDRLIERAVRDQASGG